MLGAELRNFNGTVRGIHHSLLHTLHLVAKHNCITFTGNCLKVLQCNATLAKLNGVYLITLGTQGINGIHCRLEILPLDNILGTKGSLMNLGTWRRCCYTAQHNALQAEGIAGAKHRAHIMQAAHIVEHNNQREFLGPGKRIAVNAPHLSYKFLSVHRYLPQSIFLISPSRSYAVFSARAAATLCDT